MLGCAKLREAAQAAADQAGTTAFGTPGPFGWGQTALSNGAGAIAALGGRAGVAAGARDWLLGRNPWGASFVVGYGPGAALHPHHWASVAGPGRPVGAVVGGPADLATLRAQGFAPSGPYDTAAAAYEDRRDDYVTSEPALDYTAAGILLLAALK